jgi:hypothetical protein
VLDRLTVEERRALLGDAYLGDWRPPAEVAEHGDKGEPGESEDADDSPVPS